MTTNEIHERLVARFGDAVGPLSEPKIDAHCVVKAQALVDVCRFLKAERGFDMAPYITAVDYLGQTPRFEVVYNLYSTGKNARVRLRVKLAEGEELPSVTSVWRGANWYERYCFDMYGIPVTGHPDLRRLLMYDEFEGTPLRKDYPLRGRQPLLQEREVKDIFRGPGPANRS